MRHCAVTWMAATIALVVARPSFSVEPEAARKAPEAKSELLIEAKTPPFTEGIYPCT